MAQKVVHVAGYRGCGFFQRALSVLRSVSILFPTQLKVIEHDYPDRAQFRQWLIDSDENFRSKFTGDAKQHSSSPFVWFTKSESSDDIDSFLGGHDDTLMWCRSFLSPSNKQQQSKEEASKIQVQDGFDSSHNYDYDLIVIGGGSGGMAAAKEAAEHGAKVACLDYVKPSPFGTTWGLGGTCVNVGCIPKKLFHIGSTLRESMHADSAAFGIRRRRKDTDDDKMDTTEENGGLAPMDDDNGNNMKTQVDWSVVRENIQNHIRSLNFKYRVRLREKNVTYLNKLAKFLDKNTIEATDKKGKTTTITGARFLIATGGRPSPLNCEGAEHAISSDDIFALEQSPGKTLCVGASYISLECAGFLHGLGHDVTIAVRSILLRGFDRECSDKIGNYMEETGVKFRKEVVPEKLTKLENGQIHVKFSDGDSDTFDTVLVAIGRMADTDKLGLESLGVKVNPKNRRILGKHEQTDCPNVYAVGDVLDGTPELTPVAIQAGILLAKRLFGKCNEPMDYVNVCTTVFTPIEYACVGLSEDDAISKFGAENIEVYHREFLPLEWSLSMSRSHHNSFTKVIVDKTAEENVLGIHFVGPNAGEVMQGFGTAMKCGLTYSKLTDTVGIHPTSAEEIVTLSVTKSSGEDAAAGGC